MTEATLVNRLKKFGYGQHHGPMAKACAEAADEIERLRAALEECSDELESYIMHHYDRTLDYPSQKAKYDGEMLAVIEARKLLRTAEQGVRRCRANVACRFPACGNDCPGREFDGQGKARQGKARQGHV